MFLKTGSGKDIIIEETSLQELPEKAEISTASGDLSILKADQADPE